MLQPEILLCGEATSALDPQSTQPILGLLRDINSLFSGSIERIQGRVLGRLRLAITSDDAPETIMRRAQGLADRAEWVTASLGS